MVVRSRALAKINLALHVTARRADGYHELDSLVAFAGVGDELTVTAADSNSLEITGPFATDLQVADDNIVLQAAQVMQDTWPAQFGAVAIQLTKNLPVASGIGGGSSDAAAALRAMQQLFGEVPDATRLAELALQLGADVPVCLHGQSCRMRGIGEALETCTGLPSFPAVLVNPGFAVSTPQVFAELALQPGKQAGSPMPALPTSGTSTEWLTWLGQCRNDLQRPALKLVPVISEVLRALDGVPGCQLARMSGSGATCFALFDNDAHATDAAAAIAADHPDWWVVPTIIG